MSGKLLRQLLTISSVRLYSYKSVRRPDFLNDIKKPKDRSTTVQNDASNLSAHIKAKIMATGPITVAEYMREVLTNPFAGYYMNRDVFGREGDFITSPEISQIFGELVAVWILNEWRKISGPTPFQIVELGPGRGTLSRDVLRVLTQFKLGGQFSMHLVEISPHLSMMQAQRFCFNHKTIDDANSPYYQSGETVSGIKVFWYKRLEDVPRGFSIVLAHEFFDALPIHKFQLDNGIWKEILVDVVEKQPEQFRFVLSKAQTPMSKIYEPIVGESRQCLEYSLETDRIVSMLADRLEQDGGIALIMDYGHFGEKSDTFRSFKQHKLHDPLLAPGTADLTADVDFRQIKRIAEHKDRVACFGPIEQGTFLKQMQGDARLEQLLTHALPENRETIKSGYNMLVEPSQMGNRFKFLAMFPAVLRTHLQKYPVSGFD